MLRKLSSYPRQNGLAVALREIGQIERTLFTLDWLQNVELRRRVHAPGLTKARPRTPWRAPSFATFQPPWRSSRSQLRAPALSRERAQPRRRRHRSLEHGLPRTRRPSSGRRGPDDRRDALLHHLSPLGWDQPDRRFRLVAEQASRKGRSQALAPRVRPLACYIIRILS
jgi:hypothetical protein